MYIYVYIYIYGGFSRDRATDGHSTPSVLPFSVRVYLVCAQYMSSPLSPPPPTFFFPLSLYKGMDIDLDLDIGVDM